MDISSFGYNIADIVIPNAITLNEKTKVGTLEQFNQLLSLASASGVIRVQCTIGSVFMNGAMLANPYQDMDGIECFAISMANADAPYIVAAQIVTEDDGMYVTVSITTLT